MIRWVFLFSYPPDVPFEEAEKLYLGQHAQKAKKMPGLRKYVTHRVLAPGGREPRHLRLTELWFDDFESWQKAMTSPEGAIANADRMPDGRSVLHDVVTAFVDEVPEYDFLKDEIKL